MQVRALVPIAEQLRGFLIQDLDKIKQKHLGGTHGEKILRMASYLAPRFKAHPCFAQSDLEVAKAGVKEYALGASAS